MQLGYETRQPQVAFIKKASAFSVVPVPYGIAQHRGDGKSIDLSHKALGNEQAQALGQSLNCSTVEKVTLVNNRLTKAGAMGIIQNINK